jgi:enediyne biosynthesis protein E4
MRRRNRGGAILTTMVTVGALCALVAACTRPPATAPDQTAPGPTEPAWFEDVTDEMGLVFVHDAGPTGVYFLPQVIGSGAALFDMDNDDRLDIYLIQNAGPGSGITNRLFRQRDDGRFEDVSKGSGLDIAGNGMGVAVGDVNNDGWADVVVTDYRGVRLFLNNGNRTFTEVTKAAGLVDIHWGTSASLIDFDRDGWLDLVVVHYVDYDLSQKCTGTSARTDFCHPKIFQATVTRLYRNLGPQPDGKPRFKDVTATSGLATRPGPGLGVVCADFDGDGWPDIFIANDAKPNHLWINQKNGTFREEAVERGCALNAAGQVEGNMGIAFGDVDGDGLPDLFVTHLTEETNTLWRQTTHGAFTDRTRQAGLASPRKRGTGFGVVLADFNRDGWPDLAVVNGRVARSPKATGNGFAWNDYAECNQVFANEGEGKFHDRSNSDIAFCETPRIGRALCAGDIWNRGRVDLLATYVNGPARLYRNSSPDSGHWLVARTIVPEWKRDAYGATVTLTAGDKKWSRLVQPGSGYLSSNDPRCHFGLGSVDRIDSIRVAWPDGTSEQFAGGAADRRIVLRKGEGTPLK